MNKSKYIWYLKKVKSIKLDEVCWKFKLFILRLQEKRRYAKKRKFIISNDIYKLQPAKFWGLYVRNFDVKETEIYTLELFNHYRINLNKRMPWHNAFNSMENTEWPQEFCYKLNYKHRNGFGCARINWEVNRFQFMLPMAMYYLNTKDNEALIHIKRIFYDWVKKNPFLVGISWTSAAEIAARSISWLLLGSIIKNDVKMEKLCLDIAAAVRNQLRYLRLHCTTYSTGNSDLIIVMTALALGGIAFRDRDMLRYAMEKLEAELKKLISSDGIDKEQSIHCHALIAEAIAVLVIQLKRNKISYSNYMDKLLEKMAGFLASIMDQNENVPALGDDDRGKIINLYNKEFNYYEYVLQLISLQQNKNYIKAENINRNIKLFFDKEQLEQLSEPESNDKSICYKEGGITVLKYKADKTERIMTFNHSSLHYGEVAAHRHNDALSLTLSIDGEKFIVDPGTYVYHNSIVWRNYFRSTINHNTIIVDETEQSDMTGTFALGKEFETKLKEFSSSDSEDFVSAEHYGYKPIVHYREITYKKPDLFIIKDDIQGDFVNCVQTFAAAPSVKVILNHDLAELYGEANVVYMYSSEKINMEKEYTSEMYTKKKGTNVIRCSVNNRGSHTEITTVISINKKISDEVLRRYYNNNKEEVKY
ncbi:heparinase II/III family protein [Clostridium oryzae]|uniref:Heparin-sulfate lyase n=1 Tax=Clostridium oryzae TaxID=1450648 RepID=A0A1V4J056_9CLOT|nr:heparinase II/III-family protein [Clostridium oryzae]OPJ65047.1 heparin-sulfate lyase precursor [Clostridium oryzae]